MVSHLLSLCRTFLPFHGWRCKRPGRRGARFPLQRSILGVPGCEGKYKKLPQTPFFRSRLCPLGRKSGGMMFLCHVKRTKDENNSQPFLRDQLENLRDFKVFCPL